MAIFPTHTFAKEQVKYRYEEQYISEATNTKFAGIPTGVYLGYTPTISNNILTLSTDALAGVSSARVISSDNATYSLDVVTSINVTLDFTDHTTYPINVVMKAYGEFGSPHSAEIVTQVGAANHIDEILICVVTSSTTVDATQPTNRHTPFAYANAPLGFGFMPTNSVNNLLAAVDLVNEIQAARTDLSGVLHPSLGDRIDADTASMAMADRLGKELQTIQSIDTSVVSTTTTINVSKSFSALHRNAVPGLTPVENIRGFGSETRTGAITSGSLPDPSPSGAASDTVRNVCAVINTTTEARFIDSSRNVMFGRLVYNELDLSGTLTFSIGNTTVNGAGTLFTSQVEIGDIISDGSDNYYEVATITSDLILDLSVVSATNYVGASQRRRFTLNFLTTGGTTPTSDISFVVSAGTNIRFYFPVFRSIASSQYDYLPFLFKGFEEDIEPTATTSVYGKSTVTTGAAEGKAGGVYAIQHLGGQVGPLHIHTVDFNGVADGGSGIANVSQRGPQGPAGAPGSGGSPGPAGPQGATGVGFDVASAQFFLNSGLFDHTSLGSGATYTFTSGVFAKDILFVTGGNSEWYSPGIFDADDHWEITNIEVLSVSGNPRQARISMKVPLGPNPSAQTRFYLNIGFKL